MPPRLAVLLVAFCVALNAAGFLFHLFEPILLYDELAHFITPFTLVALVAEIIYRWGGDDEFFPTPQRAIVTGTAIGLLGAVGWEIIEVILGAMGAAISNTLADSIFDVFLGVCGGALGGWFADRYLRQDLRALAPPPTPAQGEVVAGMQPLRLFLLTYSPNRIVGVFYEVHIQHPA
jgi:hypothetical protein